MLYFYDTEEVVMQKLHIYAVLPWHWGDDAEVAVTYLSCVTVCKCNEQDTCNAPQKPVFS